MSTEKTYYVTEKRLRELVESELEVNLQKRGKENFFKLWQNIFNKDEIDIPEIAKLIIDKDFQCITSLS